MHMFSKINWHTYFQDLPLHKLAMSPCLCEWCYQIKKRKRGVVSNSIMFTRSFKNSSTGSEDSGRSGHM